MVGKIGETSSPTRVVYYPVPQQGVQETQQSSTLAVNLTAKYEGNPNYIVEKRADGTVSRIYERPKTYSAYSQGGPSPQSIEKTYIPHEITFDASGKPVSEVKRGVYVDSYNPSADNATKRDIYTKESIEYSDDRPISEKRYEIYERKRGSQSPKLTYEMRYDDASGYRATAKTVPTWEQREAHQKAVLEAGGTVLRQAPGGKAEYAMLARDDSGKPTKELIKAPGYVRPTITSSEPSYYILEAEGKKYPVSSKVVTKLDGGGVESSWYPKSYLAALASQRAQEKAAGSPSVQSPMPQETSTRKDIGVGVFGESAFDKALRTPMSIRDDIKPQKLDYSAENRLTKISKAVSQTVAGKKIVESIEAFGSEMYGRRRYADIKKSLGSDISMENVENLVYYGVKTPVQMMGKGNEYAAIVLERTRKKVGETLPKVITQTSSDIKAEKAAASEERRMVEFKKAQRKYDVTLEAAPEIIRKIGQRKVDLGMDVEKAQAESIKLAQDVQSIMDKELMAAQEKYNVLEEKSFYGIPYYKEKEAYKEEISVTPKTGGDYAKFIGRNLVIGGAKMVVMMPEFIADIGSISAKEPEEIRKETKEITAAITTELANNPVTFIAEQGLAITGSIILTGGLFRIGEGAYRTFKPKEIPRPKDIRIPTISGGIEEVSVVGGKVKAKGTSVYTYDVSGAESLIVAPYEATLVPKKGGGLVGVADVDLNIYPLGKLEKGMPRVFKGKTKVDVIVPTEGDIKTIFQGKITAPEMPKPVVFEGLEGIKIQTTAEQELFRIQPSQARLDIGTATSRKIESFLKITEFKYSEMTPDIIKPQDIKTPELFENIFFERARKQGTGIGTGIKLESEAVKTTEKVSRYHFAKQKIDTGFGKQKVAEAMIKKELPDLETIKSRGVYSGKGVGGTQLEVGSTAAKEVSNIELMEYLKRQYAQENIKELMGTELEIYPKAVPTKKTIVKTYPTVLEELESSFFGVPKRYNIVELVKPEVPKAPPKKPSLMTRIYWKKVARNYEKKYGHLEDLPSIEKMEKKLIDSKPAKQVEPARKGPYKGPSGAITEIPAGEQVYVFEEAAAGPSEAAQKVMKELLGTTPFTGPSSAGAMSVELTLRRIAAANKASAKALKTTAITTGITGIESIGKTRRDVVVTPTMERFKSDSELKGRIRTELGSDLMKDVKAGEKLFNEVIQGTPQVQKPGHKTILEQAQLQEQRQIQEQMQKFQTELKFNIDVPPPPPPPVPPPTGVPFLGGGGYVRRNSRLPTSILKEMKYYNESFSAKALDLPTLKVTRRQLARIAANPFLGGQIRQRVQIVSPFTKRKNRKAIVSAKKAKKKKKSDYDRYIKSELLGKMVF